MTIRQATTTDLAQIAPLFDAYRQFYKQVPDLDGARQFLQARLENDESVVFVAFLEGAPAGFTQLYPMWSSVSMQRSWVLNDLFVADTARRHGVGEALMRQAATFAQATNAKGLSLETATDNLPAQTLYEKLGWARETAYFTYWLSV